MIITTEPAARAAMQLYVSTYGRKAVTERVRVHLNQISAHVTDSGEVYTPLRGDLLIRLATTLAWYSWPITPSTPAPSVDVDTVNSALLIALQAAIPALEYAARRVPSEYETPLQAATDALAIAQMPASTDKGTSTMTLALQDRRIPEDLADMIIEYAGQMRDTIADLHSAASEQGALWQKSDEGKAHAQWVRDLERIADAMASIKADFPFPTTTGAA